MNPPPVPVPTHGTPPPPLAVRPPAVPPPSVPAPHQRESTAPAATAPTPYSALQPFSSLPPFSAQPPHPSSQQSASSYPGDERAPLPPQTLLGNYVITTRLGQGGYGITYRARHRSKGNIVVIKEHIPVNMASRAPGHTELSFSTPEAEKRFEATMNEFLEEITILRALKYPGIVPIIDSFEANDTAYYVMPFIAGVTLDIPDKNSLDPARQRLRAHRIRRFLHYLLSTLDYLELHHIVHRDIKPDNILISTDGTPILLDFGSARQLQQGKVFTNVFTPDFCAPEQAMAESDEEMSHHIGPWTDIYSLGATFYYLITSIMPPSAEMRSHSQTDPYTRLAGRLDLAEYYGEEFLAAIDRAMEFNPRDRWGSAAEWLESLATDASAIPPRVMRNIRIFGCLAIIILLIFASLTIFAFSERSQVRSAYNIGLNFTESMLHDFSTELTDIPGSINLQRQLSANLQKYLIAMRDLPIGQDGRLDRSLAAAWFNIGCTHISLGNLKAAHEALQRAEEIARVICRKEPDDQRYSYELARIYLVRAELANRSNHSAESSSHAKAALDILSDLHTRYPDNPNYGSSLGEALAFESFYLRKQGNHQERKKVLDTLMSLYKDLAAQFPRHLDTMIGLGRTLHYHGRYAKDMEDYETADKYLAESRRVFDRLMETHPSRLSIKKWLAQTLFTLGEMHYFQSLQSSHDEEKLTHAQRADKALREHLALVQELCKYDRDNTDYTLLECQALAQISGIHLLRGEVNEAEALSRTSLEKIDYLLQKEPNNVTYIAIKARSLNNLALAHYRIPRHKAKAALELESSLALLQQHMQGVKDPAEELLMARMETLVHSASIAWDDERRDRAHAWLNEAESILNSLISNHSHPTPRQKVYSFILHHLQERE